MCRRPRPLSCSMFALSWLLSTTACNLNTGSTAQGQRDGSAKVTPEAVPPAARTTAKVIEGNAPETASVRPPTEVRDAAVHYPIALETLLDIVPNPDAQFMVVRDPSALLDLAHVFVGEHLRALPLEFGASPERAELFAAVLSTAASVGKELARSSIDLDKGIVVLDEQETIIYGAANPNALVDVLRALGVPDTELPKHCVALPKVPGYVGCGDDEATLLGITPGKHSAQLLKDLGATLPGYTLERANVLARLRTGEGTSMTFAATSAAGELQLSLGLGATAPELATYFDPGPARALAVLDPSTAFVWVNLAEGTLREQFSVLPSLVAPLTASINGELFFGGLGGGGIGVLLGLDDTSAISGLLSLVSLQLGKLPKQLPDGTKVDFSVQKVKAGPSWINALQAKLSASAVAEGFSNMGLEPTVLAFATGGYAAVTIGATDETVAAIHDPKTRTASAPRLPAAMSRSMADGTAFMAMHLPLDTFQSPNIAEYLKNAMAGMPGDTFRSTGGVAGSALLAAIAPLSSVSLWMTHSAKERVLHLSVQTFGDASEAGKAATAALESIDGGADAKSTYDTLAKTFPKSRQADSSRTRSGAQGTEGAAITSAFVFGVAAALTIPAATKFANK